MRVTIYIKPENEQLWQELDNKSAWVNDQLAGNESGLERKMKKIAVEVFDNKMKELGY